MDQKSSRAVMGLIQRSYGIIGSVERVAMATKAHSYQLTAADREQLDRGIISAPMHQWFDQANQELAQVANAQ